MKKAYINTGGAPIINDYLVQAQDGISVALNELAKGFGSTYFISGCVLSAVGTTYTLTSGWAYFNGEICRVPGHSWVDAAALASNSIGYIEVVTVANPLVYENGNSYDLTRENVLKFKARVAEPDPVYLLSFKSFSNAIGSLLKGNFIDKIASSGGSGLTLSAWTTNEGSDSFSITKLIDGRLVFKGQLNVGDGHSATINGIQYCVLMATLDAEFRPSRAIHFTAEDVSVEDSLAPVITALPGQKYVLFPDGKFCLRMGDTGFGLTAVFNNVTLQL
jgi:hypothetical protein